jgi:hypothetical protein
VTQAVVHPFEVVEVHEQHCGTPVAPMRKRELLLQALHQHGTVAQPGERVVVGEEVELFFLVDIGHREPDIPRQIVEQPHLVMIEDVDFRRVERQHAGGLAVHDQRYHHAG